MPGTIITFNESGPYQTYRIAKEACWDICEDCRLEYIGHCEEESERHYTVCFTCEKDRCHSFILTRQSDGWMAKSWIWSQSEANAKDGKDSSDKSGNSEESDNKSDRNDDHDDLPIEPLFYLNNEGHLPDLAIKKIVNDTVVHHNRNLTEDNGRIQCALMLHEQHRALWDIFLKLRPRAAIRSGPVPAAELRRNGFMAKKNSCCRDAFGTIIFYLSTSEESCDESDADEEKKSELELYDCSESIRQQLEFCGFGTVRMFSDDSFHARQIQSHWSIPESWALHSQLVFGGYAPGHPEFKPEFSTQASKEQDSMDGLLVFGEKPSYLSEQNKQ